MQSNIVPHTAKNNNKLQMNVDSVSKGFFRPEKLVSCNFVKYEDCVSRNGEDDSVTLILDNIFTLSLLDFNKNK
jgi:hypothetical protein